MCFRVRRSDDLSVNAGGVLWKAAIYEADVWTLLIGAVTNPGVAVSVRYLELWSVVFLC